MTIPVLIAGAGPTGLVLALSLARRGVRFRLIDSNSGPGEQSRAMGVHARTLEFYRQFGFGDDMVAQGIICETVHLRRGGKAGGHEVTSFKLKDLGAGLSPYPFMLAYPQDDHERFLLAHLEAAGGTVEWNTKLTDLTQDDAGVRAGIAHGDGRIEQVDAAYLCGCDGAHSAVRAGLGIGFEGGTYPQLFYVADVKTNSRNTRDISVNLGRQILALTFPVRTSGMQRLIGLVPPEFTERSNLTFEDIRDKIEPLAGIEVTEINWFSTYHSHHRVADRFQVGRAFILGDAGHVHSPAGGQGMNTGIGDAINLGWKLADVVRGRVPAAVLDTYEPERIAFARTLVATTDSAFVPMVSGGMLGEFVRRFVAPFVATVMTSFATTRRAGFRRFSQIHIHYPGSALSEGSAGHARGGDRLPWVPDASGGDNFVPLQSLDWQAHVYGMPDAALTAACETCHLPLHPFPWTETARAAGLARDAVYVVRPDGYIGYAGSSTQAATGVEAYLARIGLRLDSTPSGLTATAAMPV